MHARSSVRLAEYGCRDFQAPNKLIMCLNLLVYAWNAEGYGFIELEISNGIISTVFRQPLINVHPSFSASAPGAVRAGDFSTGSCTR